MTEKEKAQEIFDKMMQTISDDCEHSGYCTKKECNWKGMVVCHVNKNEAKECALICCEEILETRPFYPHPEGYYELMSDRMDAAEDFWQKVKEEIKKQ